jgi:hypothetical protein
MQTDNPNRYSVSSKFTLIKIFVLVGFLSIAFNLVSEFRNDTLDQKSITGLVLGTVAMAGVFYFVSTRKRIDYDDIKQAVYIVDTKQNTEIEIPVEKIDKILYSGIGFGNGTYSYLIVYKDSLNRQQKVRLFSNSSDHSIQTIIADAKLKNPNLVTRNWSFGWNELFD